MSGKQNTDFFSKGLPSITKHADLETAAQSDDQECKTECLFWCLPENQQVPYMGTIFWLLFWFGLVFVFLVLFCFTIFCMLLFRFFSFETLAKVNFLSFIISPPCPPLSSKYDTFPFALKKYGMKGLEVVQWVRACCVSMWC